MLFANAMINRVRRSRIPMSVILWHGAVEKIFKIFVQFFISSFINRNRYDAKKCLHQEKPASIKQPCFYNDGFGIKWITASKKLLVSFSTAKMSFDFIGDAIT